MLVVMSLVSQVELVVLGLLMEGERHGYDLVREMDERGLRRWTHVSKIAVYKALARLEERGCLTSWTERPGSAPEKRVYAVTSQGEERLRDLLFSLCSSRDYLRLDICAGLAFLRHLGREDAREALEARISFLDGEARRLGREMRMMRGLHEDPWPEILKHELAAYREEARFLARILSRMDGKEEGA